MTRRGGNMEFVAKLHFRASLISALIDVSPYDVWKSTKKVAGLDLGCMSLRNEFASDGGHRSQFFSRVRKCPHTYPIHSHTRAVVRVVSGIGYTGIPVPYNTECLNPILAIGARGWKRTIGESVGRSDQYCGDDWFTLPHHAWWSADLTDQLHIVIPSVTWSILWRFLKIPRGI